MLAIRRRAALVAPLLLFPALGCGLVSKSRFDTCQTQNRALTDKTKALAAEVENLRVNRENLLRKLEQTEEELALIRDETGLDREQLADFRRTRQQLKGDYQGLLAGRAPVSPETRQRLAALSKQCPALRFDPTTGVSKLDTDILFDTGKSELKPGAEEVLAQLARLLKSDEAQDLRILVVGHTDDRQIAKRPARERYPSNFYLSADRALAVCEDLRKRGVPDDRMGVAGFAAHQPVAPNVSDSDRRKNRRVEIFVMAPEVPIIGWAETAPSLY